ncbi:hypothetical protein T484DRAFT_1815492 [Baffinella frigidus]|nr:hypothetical protein T484DRAFT_1815492 [Cryptophyta sp. CCMP2293]
MRTGTTRPSRAHPAGRQDADGDETTEPRSASGEACTLPWLEAAMDALPLPPTETQIRNTDPVRVGW